MTSAARIAEDAVCAHCSLPLGGRQAAPAESHSQLASPRLSQTAPPSVAEAERLYCCAGCRIAAAIHGADGAGPARAALVRLGLGLFFSMNVMVFSMAMWSQDVYAGDFDKDDPLADILFQLFRYLGLLFSIPVVILLGEPVVLSVAQSLKRRTLSADLLILLGVVAAVLYSAVSVFRGVGHVYFEVACIVLVMLTLGRWLEASGKQRTNASLDALALLLPASVRRLENGRLVTTAREVIAVGDRLQILPGERFAVDGTVVTGRADVDQQVVTGESEPVAKQPGDPVFSGTLNLNGDLQLEVTASAGSDTLARLMELVRQARLQKGSYGRLADRLAAWFVPLMCLFAVAVAVVHGVSGGTDQGIMAGLAVILIACPCALGLAVPMAVWTAMGRSAQCGVLFRSGAALEQLAAIRALRFDKTGTLTTGRVEVATLLVSEPGLQGLVLGRAAASASVSGHHFAPAIAQFVAGETRTSDYPAIRSVATVPGKGLVVDLDDRDGQLYFGSVSLMTENEQQVSPGLAAELETEEHSAASRVCLAWGGSVRGVFLFREELRSEAARAVADCRALGLDVAILTGDHAIRGAAIAAQLGAPVLADLLPEQKVEQIAAARHNVGRVAMVGDGINDAPALAASDLGIALGCGADLSRDAAEVCLLTNDLTRLAWAIVQARRCVRVMRQNLFWAFAYNLVGVGLAATGRLNPVWAAGAMAISSVLVVSNSLRLAGDGSASPSEPSQP